MWLIALAPKAVMTACGHHQEAVAELLKMWAAMIGRAEQLTISTGCSSSADETITVYDEAQGEQPAVSWCTEVRSDGQGDDVPGGMNPRMKGKKEIYFCNGLPSSRHYSLLAHEIGHLWGLCDQYPGSEGTCDPNHSHGRGEYSIMGMVDYFTVNDLEGMRQLALRTDIQINQTWQSLVGAPTTTMTLDELNIKLPQDQNGSWPDPCNTGSANDTCSSCEESLKQILSQNNVTLNAGAYILLDFVKIGRCELSLEGWEDDYYVSCNCSCRDRWPVRELYVDP